MRLASAGELAIRSGNKSETTWVRRSETHSVPDQRLEHQEAQGTISRMGNGHIRPAIWKGTGHYDWMSARPLEMA